jgi:glycosyltransferase involved in cell wall biosynthesis
MRLCYIADPISIHTRRWLAYFAAQSHEVHLIDLRAAGRAPAPVIPGVTIHEIPKGPKLPLPRGQGLLYYPAAALRARRILRRLRPQILHAHYISEHAWVAALSGFRPLVLTAWGGDVLPEQGAFDRPIQRLLTPFAIRSAALITANAAALARVLDRYRRPSTPALVIRHGVDRTRFHPGLDTTALRRALDLGAGPVVFSPRSFQPVYQIETIVRAWPAVARARPDAWLLFARFAADPAYAARIDRLADDLGVRPSVRFAGQIEHAAMPAYYNLAAVSVSVPASDGMPVTAQEAMACGSPLIVSDLPSIAGIIEHERNGLLVPVGEAQALAAALLRLLGDEPLRRRIAEANLAWAAEYGDYHAEMGKMERAYRELVDRGKGR